MNIIQKTDQEIGVRNSLGNTKLFAAFCCSSAPHDRARLLQRLPQLPLPYRLPQYCFVSITAAPCAAPEPIIPAKSPQTAPTIPKNPSRFVLYRLPPPKTGV
jgi:hypothetical protein